MYLNLGLSDVTASRIASATSLGEEPFSNLGLNAEILFWVISAYGKSALLVFPAEEKSQILYQMSFQLLMQFAAV
jgi:hypothetical protein